MRTGGGGGGGGGGSHKGEENGDELTRGGVGWPTYYSVWAFVLWGCPRTLVRRGVCGRGLNKRDGSTGLHRLLLCDAPLTVTEETDCDSCDT